MKIPFLTLLAVFTLICSCQNKTTKAETSPTEKSCSADTTKSCCAKGGAKACCAHTDSISAPGVQVIYFHNERRCATCMAVEEGAAEVVKKIADPSTTFNSYLFGDPKNAEIEKKYNVDGQTLLIIGKGKVINFTEQAFLNARVKPDTYKEEIKAEIEKLK